MTQPELEFEIPRFLGSSDTDPSMAELVIRAGGVPLTELLDTISSTTREQLRVATYDVALWLCTRYWRLRYEPIPPTPSQSWRRAHAMASIGGGFVWPDLEVSGDGEVVRFIARAESRPDVAAVRFLRSADIEVPAAAFDTAVDRFLNRVEGRLRDVGSESALELRELREELDRERGNPEAATRCRREAAAGMDAGDAGEDWHASVARLAQRGGSAAIEDMLVAEPSPSRLGDTLDRIRDSGLTIDLPLSSTEFERTGAPWERGVDLAQRVRQTLATEGPLADEALSEVLGVTLPMPAAQEPALAVRGALRRDDGGATMLPCGGPMSSQRFYLARLLGLAHANASERAVPISDVATTSQKLGRAFAQELLLPWCELDTRTDEEGLSPDVVSRIALQYRVSELLVTTTLVNRGKLSRDRIAAFY